VISGVGVMKVLLVAMMILTLLAGPLAADWGETEIQLHCYAGYRGDNEYLGTVDVFETIGAASHCNVMYNDCNGDCTACYDDESAREVCVDNSGVPYYYD
jgi:hypothetical protein